MSYSRSLIEDLMSKNVDYESSAIYKLEGTKELDIIQKDYVRKKLGRGIPSDNVQLEAKPCVRVYVKVSGNIPGVENFNLKKNESIIFQLYEHGIKVVLPFRFFNEVMNNRPPETLLRNNKLEESLKSYLKELGYKEISLDYEPDLLARF